MKKMFAKKGTTSVGTIVAIVLVLLALAAFTALNIGKIKEAFKGGESIITKCAMTDKTYDYYKRNIKTSLENQDNETAAELYNEFVRCFPNEKLQKNLKLSQEDLFALGKAEYKAENYMQARKLLVRYKESTEDDEKIAEVDSMLDQIDSESGFV